MQISGSWLRPTYATFTLNRGATDDGRCQGDSMPIALLWHHSKGDIQCSWFLKPKYFTENGEVCVCVCLCVFVHWLFIGAVVTQVEIQTHTKSEFWIASIKVTKTVPPDSFTSYACWAYCLKLINKINNVGNQKKSFSKCVALSSTARRSWVRVPG